jgi:SecD/SecF fusion protein
MHPIITFLSGASILMLFIFYIGTIATHSKRVIGSILILAVTAFSLITLKTQPLKKGIDLNGGGEFVVELQKGTDAEGNDKQVNPDSIQQAIGILEKRLNPDATKDLTLLPMGKDRIQIQMPGVKPEEISEVRQKIEQVAKLEFRLVDQNSAAELAKINSGHVSIGNVKMKVKDPKGEGDTELVVKNRAELDGKAVKSSYAYLDPGKGWVIILNFDTEGGKKFGELTAANVGHRLAVVVDNEVVSAPNLNEAIYGGHCEITGHFTEATARGLASALENPLENPMKILSESTVSAAYGESAINQGKWAIVFGFLVTVVFMLIYYRMAGLIACVGLVLGLLTLIGAMSLFDFTLTMPGIAGIVLTMGMAVDANVLIYERLREEQKSGKTLIAALDTAFEKAFAAIFDSNVTTLITASILFFLASGLVKGFAVTLTIGVISGGFGALVVTRVLFHWFVDTGKLKTLSTAKLIHDKIFDVLKIAPGFIIASLVLTAISLSMFFIAPKMGKNPWGIDFRGGAQTTIQLHPGKDINEAEVRAVIDKVTGKDGKGIGTYFVQPKKSLGGDNMVTITSEYDAGPAVEEACKTKFAEGLVKGTEAGRVGSVIGEELKSTGLWALIAALVAIFAWLVLRFEFAFALGATIALFHDVVMVPGLCVLFGQELTVIHIGALLTIAGYSVHDTIIVFDRIREVIHSGRQGTMRELMNEAISMTLSRTLLTSLTVLNTVVVLLFFGNQAMLDFAVPIVIGVILGTYSSIFIASPIVLWWANYTGTSLHRQVLDSKLRKEEMDKAALAAQAGL